MSAENERKYQKAIKIVERLTMPDRSSHDSLPCFNTTDHLTE
jgi:hypothetical protein